MLGRTVSHYRIVSRLGSGGMGVVYAGEDTRLGRPVALKFVPEELAKDGHAVDRLRAEARAASALNHPNICTIYDIGEDDGRPFIVMELIKGGSLSDMLASGPLKIRYQVVDVGIQVADALDAAHSQGILHRDIKPANLFVTEHGQVKVLDFGLAKLLPHLAASSTTASATMEHLTTQGVTVGTVAYMSPEQVTGEQLDGRTDLFSLGVVLYECVTGHRPFTGKTSAVVFSAILNRAPVAPVILNPDTPLRLQEIINNCLEKDRELRCQDAAGVRADLRRLRRDLDSQHSEVQRVISGVTEPPSGGTAPSAAAAAPEAGDSSAAPAPSGPHPSRSVLTTVVAIAATVALTAVVSYFVWSRASEPVRETAPDQAAVDATIQGRQELASTSLQARNYRAALVYAEEVLRVVPGDAEAIRVRDAARAMIARVDEMIARADQLLAAGDVNGASEALEGARAIDPAAPAIAELSARLVARFKGEAEAARQRAQQARTTAPPPQPQPRPGPVEPTRPAAPRPSVPEGAPAASPSAPSTGAPSTSAPSTPAPAVPPQASPPSPAPVERTPPSGTSVPAPRPQVVEPAPAEAPGREAEKSAPRPSRAEDDDTAIRRVVETYRRAIETKDVALFRAAKPNLTSEEQRRIEEGFRAVSSQQVSITILSITINGSNASVRLRRRDTFMAGGRQQTNNSQQTLMLIRTNAGWVIEEIG